MTVSAQHMLAEELLNMPEDGFRYELVRGELKKMTPAGNEHGEIAAALGGFLFYHVRSQKLGKVYAAETGFRIFTDPDTVRAPDVAFINHSRLEEVGAVEGYWPGAPDLVVEVISPNDNYSGVEEKVFDWLKAGSQMVLVINPRQHTATVYRSSTDIRVLKEGEVLDGADVVPGWQLEIAELFT
jgi:Uma2 family endonuclease